MKKVKQKALRSFRGTTLSHWFRFKIKTQEVKAFTENINSVEKKHHIH